VKANVKRCLNERSTSDAEKAAFETSPTGLNYGHRGTDSDDAWRETDALANTISNAIAKLEQLVESNREGRRRRKNDRVVR
jgi:hypothetical protein